MNFFVLEHNSSEIEHFQPLETDFYFDSSVRKGPAPTCSKCFAYVGSLTTISPYSVHLEVWGEDFGDIAFGASDDVLVSKRFKDAYERSGLRGLVGFEPVEVLSVKFHGKKKTTTPVYFKTNAIRGSARLDVTASGFRYETPPTCVECLSGLIKGWQRIVVDIGSWNGDDIFSPVGLPGTLIVSTKFFDWAMANTFRNVILHLAVDCPSENAA